jgi:hypothetical protein
MRLAELADDPRHPREGWGRERREREGREGTRPAARPTRRAVRQQRTGFEPFLIAAVLGLGIWALILTPLFL